MSTQEQLLAGTDIPTDTLPNHTFDESQLAFLAVAEGIAFNEWARACGGVGLSPNVEVVPANCEAALQRQGAWTLDY